MRGAKAVATMKASHPMSGLRFAKIARGSRDSGTGGWSSSSAHVPGSSDDGRDGHWRCRNGDNKQSRQVLYRTALRATGPLDRRHRKFGRMGLHKTRFLLDPHTSHQPSDCRGRGDQAIAQQCGARRRGSAALRTPREQRLRLPDDAYGKHVNGNSKTIGKD